MVKREDVVRLSRSGRVLKRPLASWAGEHIVYDVYGNAVKAVGVTTESSMTTGGGIETSAVVSHLGLSPLHGPRQKERESLGCRGYPKPKRRSSNKRHSIASSNSSLVCESPTSFVGQQRKQAWHVIKSSPEEDHGTAATNQKAKKAKHLKKTKRPRNRGVLKKKTAKKVAERRSEKENQTAEANNEEVENMELNAPRDDDEGSVSVTEFVADETRSSEGAVVEGRTQLEKHQSCSRWRKDEIERLKLAMRALAPREEMDWEKVAKSLDGREASECLAEAQKRWGWRPQKRLTQLQEESQLEKLAYAAGKAKVGTVSYQVKAQRFTRKYMVAGGESDFFEETMALSTSNMVKGLPSVASFDPDDSLLDVLRTPVPSNVKRINQRQFIPDLVASTDSSHDESRSPAVRIVDSAERDRREFYVYKLLKNKSCNTSRFNASCMDVSKGRTFRKYQLNIPASAHSFDGEQEEQDAGDDEYFSSDDDN
ncbi:unnamed protein product [Toxocara canis]|uniref:Myb-like domain-containing protein n=1 Tax=Toxocara canis TaxID=6265 RepID=A0A183VDA7_TOXCA|nr:unnamed protein product [Toxocara canis]